MMKTLRERMQDAMDDYTDSIVWVDSVIEKWDEAEHPRGKTTPESNSGSFAPKQWAEHHEAINTPLRDATTLTMEDVKAGKYPLLRHKPRIAGTDYIVGQYTPTPEGPLPGVVTLSDKYFVRDSDPTLDEIGRKTLLLHEIGHALPTAMSRIRGDRGWDEWHGVLAPFKTGGSGAQTTWNWPSSASSRSEEILADVYADLMYSKTQPWEEETGKYAPVYKYVLAMAADAGLPLPAWYLRKDEHGWEASEHPRGKTTEESNEGSFTFKTHGYSAWQKRVLREAKAKQKAFEKNGGQKGVRYDAKLEADAVTEEQARELMYHISGLEDIKAKQSGVPYQGPKTFVKNEGHFMPVPDSPPPIKLRTMKECFKNSTDFVMEHGERYDYCEGYVFLPNLPIPIHHAWVWDNKTGTLIDPTLGWMPKAQYWGVKFSSAFLIANIVKQKYYGLLMQGDTPTDLVLGNDELYEYRMEGA